MLNQQVQPQKITVYILSIFTVTVLILSILDYLLANIFKGSYRPLIACACDVEIEDLFFTDDYVQIYLNKYGQFPHTQQEIKDLLKYQQEHSIYHYNYQIQSSKNTFFTSIKPETPSSESKAYISAMFITGKKETDKNNSYKNLTTIRIICETEIAWLDQVTKPINHNGKLYCEEGTKEVRSKFPFKHR